MQVLADALETSLAEVVGTFLQPAMRYMGEEYHLMGLQVCPVSHAGSVTAWQVLLVASSCLDSFLVLESNCRLRHKLLALQEELRLPDGTFIVDEPGLVRNKILVCRFR